MRVLMVGAGGVGTAITRIAARRSFFEHMVVADYDPTRAESAVAGLGEGGRRFTAARLDASDSAAVRAALAEYRCDVLLNATDPRFVLPLFDAALSHGAHYLDMAMSLSRPHPTRPYQECGVKLGDAQFERAAEWEAADRLALVGMGVEPGLSDVFARYAADELFDEDGIEEIGIRDGADLVVDGYDFAPSFSIWTTIEECLNPPVVYEEGRGWFTTPPFSEPEVFDFPEGIGPVECVNVEHEEVLLVPRWLKAEAGHLQVRPGRRVHRRAQDPPQAGPRPHGPGHRRHTYRGKVAVSPRDVVAACLPDPGGLGDRMHGKTCAGTWVKGTKDGRPREVYLYHVVDNQWSMREYGSQAVVWQTAINPVAALELIASGAWQRQRRARPRGTASPAVPRPADGVRLAVGHARGPRHLTSAQATCVSRRVSIA